jgi:hypothetical protein
MRTVGCLCFSIFGPVLVMSAYLYFSRWPNTIGTPDSDYFFIAISVAFGAASVSQLPTDIRVRVLLVLAYVPIAIFFVFIYAVFFVGIVFGIGT